MLRPRRLIGKPEDISSAYIISIRLGSIHSHCVSFTWKWIYLYTFCPLCCTSLPSLPCLWQLGVHGPYRPLTETVYIRGSPLFVVFNHCPLNANQPHTLSQGYVHSGFYWHKSSTYIKIDVVFCHPKRRDTSSVTVDPKVSVRIISWHFRPKNITAERIAINRSQLPVS